MYLLKKSLAILLLVVLAIPTSSVMALDVRSAVTSLQTTDVSLPAVANPKGNIGFILATIFGSSGNSLGKIQAQYLDYSGISAWTQSGSQTWLTTTTGSVGIGTISPTASLDVKRTTADSNFAAYIDGTDTANYGLWVNIANTTSNKAIADFKSGNISRMYIRGDGNVGIGTTSPGSKLQIEGDAGVHITPQNTMLTINDTNTTAPGRKLRIWNSLNTARITQNLGYDGTSYNLDNIANGGLSVLMNNQSYGIDFATAGANPRTVSRVFQVAPDGTTLLAQNGGNVGIGTTSPDRTLDINSTGTLGARIRSTSWASAAYLYLQNDTSNFGVLSYAGSSTSEPNLLILRNNANVGIAINTSGNVGIGTTSPGAKLDVRGDIFLGAGLSEKLRAGANLSYIEPYNISTGDMTFYSTFASAGFNFNTVNSATPKVRIDSTGNVGIGTTSPSQKLDVNGNIITSGYILRGSHSSGYLVGSYNNIGANDSKSNPIYTIGTAYVPTDTTTGNMYGIGYSYSNFWGVGKPTGWGLYTASNGTIGNVIADSGIWTAGSITAVGTATAATPTAGAHLATKAYVDAAIGAAGGSSYNVKFAQWSGWYWGWSSSVTATCNAGTIIVSAWLIDDYVNPAWVNNIDSLGLSAYTYNGAWNGRYSLKIVCAK